MIIILKSHFHTLQQQIAIHLQQTSSLPTSPSLPVIYVKQPLIVTKTLLAEQPLEDPLASKALKNRNKKK